MDKNLSDLVCSLMKTANSEEYRWLSAALKQQGLVYDQTLEVLVETGDKIERHTLGSLWAAKDEDGTLCLYMSKPTRYPSVSVWDGRLMRIIHEPSLIKQFEQLKWEDEPWKINLVRVR